MQRFDKVVSRAITALSDCCTNSSIVSSTIKVFDDLIVELAQKALEEITLSRSNTDPPTSPDPKYLPNPLIVTMVRFHLHTFQFFGHELDTHLSGMVELYDLACQWTQQAQEFDRHHDWALYASESWFRHMNLVATVLLRITHSHQLRSCIDLARGERAYFAIVRFLKRRSLQSWDVNAKMGNMFSQLWHNDNCFRRPDGSYDSLFVATRTRGVS